MSNNLDLAEYEDLDKAVAKHIKDNPDIDLIGDEHDWDSD